MAAAGDSDLEISALSDIRLYTGVTTATSANERLTILNNGKVGIGVDNPDPDTRGALLHVSGGGGNVVKSNIVPVLVGKQSLQVSPQQ